ncbi:MAG TPA: T9SS type A sorting domain-containing protein [Bacteroidales bacterium]|nr:T9SS type A sorting domain-containing protein [Bacteroidales bacterium]
MNTICKLLICVAILICENRLSVLFAQEVIPASGGEISGMYGSVSYSVGQVFYTTNTGVTGSLTQGVQQPFEVSVILGKDESEGIDLMISAYPNPVTDYLILKLDDASAKNFHPMSFQLFDINGKLLENKILTERLTTVSLKDFAPSIYHLRVTDNIKVIKVFKIIKN